MKKKDRSIYFRKCGIKQLVLSFWLLLWEILCRRIHNDIFLPSPRSVGITLISLTRSFSFWLTIAYSALRIILGFFIALVIGIILAVTSHNIRVIRELISPIMKIMKAVPVASFILLAILWVGQKNLSTLTSFMMVVPLIYANVLQGLQETDDKLLEMAKVFHLNTFKKIIAIFIPAVMPYFIAAVSVGIGLSWKAGIAAEVIGIPNGSIGKQLYEAKLYLMTKELFAWTIVIIIVSILFENAVIHLLGLIRGKIKKNEEESVVL